MFLNPSHPAYASSVPARIHLSGMQRRKEICAYLHWLFSLLFFFYLFCKLVKVKQCPFDACDTG